MNRELDVKLGLYIDDLIGRYPKLGEIKEDIISGYFLLEECYLNGGKLLVAGNGGSAADSEHIVGELMKSFKKKRCINDEFAKKLVDVDSIRGQKLAKQLQGTLPAISLVAHESLSTAYINDVDGLGVFSQQLYGFGKENDVFLAISTSGNSDNILNAVVVAKALGLKVLGLTGKTGGDLSKYSDVSIIVPEFETYLIQEYHLPIYHCWCLMLEERFFDN